MRSVSRALVVTIFMTVVELMGTIPESGLRLNAFSIVNLCVAVGMTVEFTAHIVHRFLEERGEDRHERVIGALRFMGPAMMHGMITSLISIAFLGASETKFIREYYFQMYAYMLLIAAANGLILLPVLLSLFGDEPLSGGDTERSLKYYGQPVEGIRGDVDFNGVDPEAPSSRSSGGEASKQNDYLTVTSAAKQQRVTAL